jgi:hypothetical protein
VLLSGLALIAVALGALAFVHSGYAVHILPELVVFGIGGGLTLPALAGLAMARATPEDAGAASGLFNTGQQVGAAIGVAALSSVAAARTLHLAASGRSGAAALTGGYHLAFGVGGGLAVVALAVSAALVRARRGAAPEPVEGRDAEPAAVAE